MKSQFSDLFNTNYSPSPLEVLQIKSLLPEPMQRVSFLDLDILRVQTLLASLQRERDRLSELVNAYITLLSPVRRLPHDVLRLVFKFCLPCEGDKLSKPQDIILMLAGVCKTWRNIAFSTPTLWSSLYLSFPSFSPTMYGESVRTFHGFIQATNTWLARSGPCGLSLTIKQRNPCEFRFIQDFLEILLPHASRLISLEIAAPYSTNRLFSEGLNRFCPVNLRKLSARSAQDHQVIDLHAWKFLESCSLTSVTFGLTFQGIFPELPITWSTITELTLDRTIYQAPYVFSAGIMLQVLEKCSQLQKCNIVIGDSEVSNSPKKITMQNLWSLVVRVEPGVDAEGFFTALDLPSLRNLAYEEALGSNKVSHTPIVPVAPLTAIFVNKPCLESLSLTVESIQEALLLDCIKNISSLTHLSLHAANPLAISRFVISDTFLRNLTPSHILLSQPCSQLKEFICDRGDFSGQSVVDFLQTRGTDHGTGTGSLKRAKIGLMKNGTQEVHQEHPVIKALISNGMEISMLNVPMVNLSEPSRGGCGWSTCSSSGDHDAWIGRILTA